MGDARWKQWMLAATIGVVGCDDSSLDLEERIRFGEEDSAHPEVVQLHIPLADGGLSGCTATVVTATRVLTAAHCVDQLDGPASDITVFVEGEAHHPVAVEIHPGWARGVDGFFPSLNIERANDAGLQYPILVGTVDLAVLHMAASADLGVEPAEVAPGTSLSIDELVTIVGYGRDETELGGTRHAALVRFIRPAPARTPTGSLSVTGGTLAVEPEAGAIACSGDSGGPLFDRNGRIAGVYSNFVFNTALATDVGQCNATLNGVYTNASPFSNWILGDLAPHQNPSNKLDVNRDGSVSPVDALAIIRQLNLVGGGPLAPTATLPGALDVNGDGWLSPSDALVVIRHLNLSVF